jgi:outer membrane receptor for ferric coprogen and ferric-rhodotorulic acid
MKTGTDTLRAATHERRVANGWARCTAIHILGLAGAMLVAGPAFDTGGAACAGEVPIVGAASAAIGAGAGTEVAQRREARAFSIPAQPLPAALDAFAAQAGVSFAYRTGDLSDLRSPGVSGTMTPEQALQRLLVGTGITWRFTDASTITLARVQGGSTTTLGTIAVEGRAPSDPGSTEGTNSYTGSQVTVGSKIPTSIRETPQSVSVITRQRIEDQSFTTVEDAVRQTTGMTIRKFDGAGIFNDMEARGFSNESLQFDGLNVRHFGNAITAADMAVYDRVEVLRGPAGLFKGAGEPSGAINLVRKRPLDQFQIGGALSAGSWDFYRGEADITGSILENNRVRGRFVAAYEDRDSFVDIIEKQTGTAYGTIDVDLTNRTLFSVGAIFQDVDSVYDRGLPAFADGRLLDVKRSTYIGADWGRIELQRNEGFAELEHRFENGGKVKFSTRIVDWDTGAKYAFSNTAVDSDGNVVIRTSQNRNDGLDSTFDLHGTTPFELGGLKHNFLVGVDLRTEHLVDRLGNGPNTTMNVFQPNHAIPEPDILFATKRLTESQQFGAYGQLRVKPIESTTLVLGGRLSWFDTEVSNELTGTQTASASVDQELTPYAAVLVDISENHTLYGSYADIFQPQTNLTVDDEVVEPRTGRQFEVGVKGEYLQGQLNAHIAAFDIRDKNRAVSDPLNDTFFIASGEVQSRGFEAEVSGLPHPGLDLVAGYAFTNTKYIRDPDSQGQTFSEGTPKHSLKFWSKYTFQPGSFLDGFNIGGGLIAVSSFGAESGGVRFEEDGYAVVSARFGYQLNRNLEASFSITNVFDEKYYAHLAGATRQNYYGEPRAFLLSLRAKW